ncbi:MAG: methyltransferase domain-containing protein, partial [Alphaproteobacteria bacterium]|nr:methyltransferase domain-containing protein [Alphaproteobacteria bacterium]
MASSYLAGEVPYPAKFHALMAPAWINYAAARNGYLPRRIEDGFTYLDLGCGSALTLVTLAAANPQGRFIGIDLDPGHIDHGRAIATKAGLDNVDLISGDFAEIPEGELPALDFAVLHGFFSWVGPEVRRRALDMLSRKVAEGGLVLVSYNAMPGWSAVAPLREMMLAIMDRVQGTLLDKVIGARERLRRLRDGGAYLFKAVPAASDALDEILTQDPRYLAHEYFTGHWGLFYSPDVIAAMSEAGFAFCGSLPPGLNEPALALPPGLVDMATADRPFFEMLRDFSNCERLRIDVYRRGPAAPLTGLARMHGYESLIFGTVEGAPKSRVDVTVGDRVLRLDHTQPPSSNLVAMLSEGPVGFSHLIRELSPLAPT